MEDWIGLRGGRGEDLQSSCLLPRPRSFSLILSHWSYVFIMEVLRNKFTGFVVIHVKFQNLVEYHNWNFVLISYLMIRYSVSDFMYPFYISVPVHNCEVHIKYAYV